MHFLIASLLAVAAPAPAPPAPPVPPSSQPADTGCSAPVYLVVWIDHLDRSKSKAYGEALRSSGIVKRNGGQYQMVSPPALLLEGEWPADRGFVVERYPCLAAFKAMWYSEEYQKRIKPLRDNSGTYTVALFNSYPPPAAAVPAK